MSVVKLKLVKAVGARGAFSAYAQRAAAEDEFYAEDGAGVLNSTAGYVRSAENDPYAPMLTRLHQTAQRLGITLENTSPPDMTDEQICASLDALDGRAAALEGDITAAKEHIREYEMMLEQLSHISGLDISLDELFALKHFKLRFGHMPAENYDALSSYSSEADDYFFFVAARDKNDVWGVRLTTAEDAERIDSLFTSLGFERFYLSERAHGTPAQAYESISQQLREDKKRLSELEKEMAELKKTASDSADGLYSVLCARSRGYDLKNKALYTDDTFTLYGYVPAKKAKKIISRISVDGVDITCTEPTADAPSPPPTILHNAWFFRPFEEYVKMYGMPNYREIDPTPLVALTYMLFFGIMFGDVAQGAIIILAGALMWFLKGMFIGRILTRVGITSMLFGLFYGSVFGYEDILPGFKVNEGENMNITLIAAVAFGAVIISLCICMNIANGIRQRDVGRALFSGNGVAALVFYWSVIILVLAIMNFIPVSVPVIVLAVIIGICFMLILLRTPLENAIAGRKKLVPGTWLDYILESFFELFEVALSFVTNTISYIRLGAFALSHVGMMSVVFLLAQTANGTHNPVIIILGNLFVTGFEGMIVCIQALRLEFYEIFSRFYSGDGRQIENK